MTIQLPILIWTVICFCVLMLILNRLLFRPLLSFMDARQAKIDRAHAKRDAARAAQLEAQQAADAALHAAEDHARCKAQADLDEARSAAARDAEEREQMYTELRTQTKSALDAEERGILEKLNGSLDALSSAFAEKLSQ